MYEWLTLETQAKILSSERWIILKNNLIKFSERDYGWS